MSPRSNSVHKTYGDQSNPNNRWNHMKEGNIVLKKTACKHGQAGSVHIDKMLTEYKGTLQSRISECKMTTSATSVFSSEPAVGSQMQNPAKVNSSSLKQSSNTTWSECSRKRKVILEKLLQNQKTELFDSSQDSTFETVVQETSDKSTSRGAWVGQLLKAKVDSSMCAMEGGLHDLSEKDIDNLKKSPLSNMKNVDSAFELSLPTLPTFSEPSHIPPEVQPTANETLQSPAKPTCFTRSILLNNCSSAPLINAKNKPERQCENRTLVLGVNNCIPERCPELSRRHSNASGAGLLPSKSLFNPPVTKDISGGHAVAAVNAHPDCSQSPLCITPSSDPNAHPGSALNKNQRIVIFPKGTTGINCLQKSTTATQLVASNSSVDKSVDVQILIPSTLCSTHIVIKSTLENSTMINAKGQVTVRNCISNNSADLVEPNSVSTAHRGVSQAAPLDLSVPKTSSVMLNQAGKQPITSVDCVPAVSLCKNNNANNINLCPVSKQDDRLHCMNIHAQLNSYNKLGRPPEMQVDIVTKLPTVRGIDQFKVVEKNNSTAQSSSGMSGNRVDKYGQRKRKTSTTTLIQNPPRCEHSIPRKICKFASCESFKQINPNTAKQITVASCLSQSHQIKNASVSSETSLTVERMFIDQSNPPLQINVSQHIVGRHKSDNCRNSKGTSVTQCLNECSTNKIRNLPDKSFPSTNPTLKSQSTISKNVTLDQTKRLRIVPKGVGFSSTAPSDINHSTVKNDNLIHPLRCCGVQSISEFDTSGPLPSKQSTIHRLDFNRLPQEHVTKQCENKTLPGQIFPVSVSDERGLVFEDKNDRTEVIQTTSQKETVVPNDAESHNAVHPAFRIDQQAGVMEHPCSTTNVTSFDNNCARRNLSRTYESKQHILNGQVKKLGQIILGCHERLNNSVHDELVMPNKSNNRLVSSVSSNSCVKKDPLTSQEEKPEVIVIEEPDDATDKFTLNSTFKKVCQTLRGCLDRLHGSFSNEPLTQDKSVHQLTNGVPSNMCINKEPLTLHNEECKVETIAPLKSLSPPEVIQIDDSEDEELKIPSDSERATYKCSFTKESCNTAVTDTVSVCDRNSSLTRDTDATTDRIKLLSSVQNPIQNVSQVHPTLQAIKDEFQEKDNFCCGAAEVENNTRLLSVDLPTPASSLHSEDESTLDCDSSCSVFSEATVRYESDMESLHCLSHDALESLIIACLEAKDTHITFGVQMLSNYCNKNSKPGVKLIEKVLTILSKTDCALTMQVCCSMLQHLNHIHKVFDSLPLWDLIETCASHLQFHVEDSINMQANLFVIEIITRILEKNLQDNWNKTKSLTYRYLDPDCNSWRIKCILKWMTSSFQHSGFINNQTFICCLLKLLQVAIEGCKNPETFSSNIAHELCTLYRGLPTSELRRKFILLVKPLSFRIQFLSIILEMHCGVSKASLTLDQSYVSAKLSLGKIVHYYFSMRPLATFQHQEESIKNPVMLMEFSLRSPDIYKEWIYILLNLMEAYCAIQKETNNNLISSEELTVSEMQSLIDQLQANVMLECPCLSKDPTLMHYFISMKLLTLHC